MLASKSCKGSVDPQFLMLGGKSLSKMWPVTEETSITAECVKKVPENLWIGSFPCSRFLLVSQYMLFERDRAMISAMLGFSAIITTLSLF